MPNTLLSAREIYDIAPLGSRIQFSDGTPEPPARHRRKRTVWLSNNGTARLVRKKPADHLSDPSLALHLGNFGSGDVTVVEASQIDARQSEKANPAPPLKSAARSASPDILTPAGGE
jgi:hypothetical protein